MGEAKRRGSREERIQQARREHQREEPINVPCQTCKEVLNGFTYLQSTPAGAAWQKACPNCGAVTSAVVQARHSTMSRAFKSTLALKDAIVGADNDKVSVSFLEKTVDTVETGLIRLG